MMRPRGRPPTPRARSMASEPVESVSTFILALLPRRMIEPSPNCLVMLETASSMFFSRAGLADFSDGATRDSDLDLSALDMGTGMGGLLGPFIPQGNDNGMSGDICPGRTAGKDGVRKSGQPR